MRAQHQESSVIGIGGADAVPKYANIAVASSGDNILVAAVSSNKIRVVSVFLMAAADVDAYFVDGANGAICGDGTNSLDLTANSGFVLPFNPVGWFETASGQSLDLNLGGAIRVAGCLTYIEVPA
jgi:hypothetical protein